MVMAEKKTTSQIVEEHKPKNYKFKYVITDPTLEKELIEAGFDMTTLDTINDADLVADALAAPFQSYPREVVATSQKPTQIENGVLLFKKMVTKTDKKLQNVKVGFFQHNNLNYACIKFVYERFEIIEIFILT
jgi:hypothetical protein